MQKLGTPITSRIHIGRFELRVGALSQAGLLLPSHSMGILDKVDMNFAKSTMSRKAGFPQDIVASEITEQTMTLTATCGEMSKRNIKLLANTGLADYDTVPNEVNSVVTTSDISAGAESITFSADGASSQYYIAQQDVAGATAAKAINDLAYAVSGATSIYMSSVVYKAADAVTRAGAAQIQYHAGLVDAAAIVNTASNVAGATDDFVYSVLAKANTVLAGISNTATSAAADTYRDSADALRDAIAASANLAAVQSDANTAASGAGSTTGAYKLNTFVQEVAALAGGTPTAANMRSLVGQIVAALDSIVLYSPSGAVASDTRTAYKLGVTKMVAVMLAAKDQAATAAQMKTLTDLIVSSEADSINDFFNTGFSRISAIATASANASLTIAQAKAAVDAEVTRLGTVSAEAIAATNVPYIIYDAGDPANLSVIEFSSASIVGSNIVCQIADPTKFVSNFAAGADVRVYKPAVLKGGNDAAVSYFSLRLIRLDAKTKQPNVYDFWKASINDSTNLSLNNTDFTNFDVAFTVMRPVPQDYLLVGSDLFHQRAAIQEAPMYRLLEIADI